MSHGIFGSGVAPLPDTSQRLSPRGRAATSGDFLRMPVSLHAVAPSSAAIAKRHMGRSGDRPPLSRASFARASVDAKGLRSGLIRGMQFPLIGKSFVQDL